MNKPVLTPEELQQQFDEKFKHHMTEYSGDSIGYITNETMRIYLSSNNEKTKLTALELLFEVKKFYS